MQRVTLLRNFSYSLVLSFSFVALDYFEDEFDFVGLFVGVEFDGELASVEALCGEDCGGFNPPVIRRKIVRFHNGGSFRRPFGRKRDRCGSGGRCGEVHRVIVVADPVRRSA